jgi:phosphoribosylformimino-5-aminoimidazole carboxamide ribotide isomerase
MEIIPVLDLLGGTVVRARMGRRDQYRPIETPLSRTSAPVDVARGLMGVHPFRTLYVADLDAIGGGSGNDAALRALQQAFAGVTLWVDNGIADAARAEAWLGQGLGCLVVGSETQGDASLVTSLTNEPRAILSLDFRGSDFQGSPELLADPACWPARAIVMTLARVGSGAGPDLDRLAAIRAAAPDRAVYAAGGVRDAGDLVALARRGIAGALVATALHDGRLAAMDVAGFCALDHQT